MENQKFSASQVNRQLYFFILTCIFILAGSFTFAQSTENAIVNYDLSFSIYMKLDCANDRDTSTFEYADENDVIHVIRTLDTMMDYTIQRLEQINNIEILPVKIGIAKRTIAGKLKGFPNVEVSDAVKLGKYDHMFDISVKVFSTDFYSTIWGADNTSKVFSALTFDVDEQKSKINMDIKIEEFDSKGKRIASYDKRSSLNEISKNGIVKFNTTQYRFVNGNEFFAFYIGALENTLINGNKHFKKH